MDAEPVTPDAFLVFSAQGLLPLLLRPAGQSFRDRSPGNIAPNTCKLFRLEPPGRR